MLDIIKKNVPFFIGFVAFLVAGLVLLLTTEKGGLILYFSDHRSAGGDVFFRYATKLGELLPYVAGIAALLFVRFRYALLIPAIGLSVGIVTAITKSLFAHNRPSLYFKEMGIFEQINIVEGVELWERFSFPSGHTMSAFAVYGMLTFVFNGKKIFGIAMIALAVLVGFSRIYLVQHFLQDVYLGAILGVLIAMSVYHYQSRFPYNPDHWIDRSLSFKKKKELA